MEPDTPNPAAEASPGNQIVYKRVPADEFFEDYANNVFVNSGTWDLTLTFGKFDPSQGENVVKQYASIILTWAQAKALLYFLGNHVAGAEAVGGRIQIPKGVVPRIAEPSEHFLKAFPPGVAQKVFETLRERYNEFAAQNPEIL